MALINLSNTHRRRLSTFFICLIIAGISWLFFALSNRYNYTLTTRIQYYNFPESKAFHPLQDDSVTLKVEGSGWQLLFSRLPFRESFIRIDLQGLTQQSHIILSSQLEEINRQLNGAQRIVAVNPDTLFFDFSSQSSKKVPVRLVSDLKFRKQYNISAPVKIKPAYVTINGPWEDLKKISAWPTDTLKLENIRTSVSRNVRLSSGQKSNIYVNPQTVKVTVPVEEFTEAGIEIPVKVINNKNYEVKLFPEKVKIVYLASLSNYPKITRDDFEVVADLDKWTPASDYSQLSLKLTRFPSYCKLLRLEPQTVDFFVKE